MKKFASAMLAMMCAFGVAHAREITISHTDSHSHQGVVPQGTALTVLYDQYDNVSTQGASSQDFETANDGFDNQAADDFVIPSGVSWSIQSVSAAGQYFNGPGPADSFNVYFYADAAGLPGSLLASQIGATYTDSGTGSPVIALSTPVVLTEGTYWVSVQARMDFTPNGQWAWDGRTVQSGSPSAFQNPGGGFACSGGNGWVVLTTCVTTTDPDLVFRLEGASTPVVLTDSIFCSSFEDGEDGSCGSVAGPWVAGATGPAKRYRAGGTSDGTSVYVFGGSNDAAAYLNDLWKWDPATAAWTQLANMPTGKSNIQGAYLNGKIYVPGGYTGSHITENAIYDIASNTWSTGAPMPAAQTGMTAAYSGKIYVFGGNPGPQTTLEIYDPVADTWTAAAPMPVATTYGRAVTAGAYMYIIGGIAGTVVANVWRYDPAADTYTAMAPLQTARTSEELMASGNSIYAVNGGDSSFFSGVPLAQTVEVYNIPSDTWSYGAPVVTTAAASSGGLAGGKLMIMGGVDSTTYYDLVQISTLVPQ